MNWRFWNRAEKRSGYTSYIVDAIVAAAEGSVGSAASTSALEAASSLYANAFSIARHTGTRALGPFVLSESARRLIRYGEAVWLITVEGGKIRLLPVSSWTITGGYTESDWLYRCEIPGPTKSLMKISKSDGVLHFRYSVDPLTPWQGLGPLQNASASGTLAGQLEKKLGQEISANSALLIPVPQDGGDGSESDPLATLKTDLKSANGGVVLTETTSSGWTEGMTAAPRRDWQQARIGPEPPEILGSLRKEVFRDVMRACGVPSALVDDADGTAQREAYRRFVMTSCEGLARRMQEEIEAKLEESIDLDFGSMWAHDVVGRSQSCKRLVDAGMPLGEAQVRVGF